MEANVCMLALSVVFYIIIVFIGAYASWKSYRRLTANGDDLILGNRSFGAFISIVSLTATWVSGIYISGTFQTIHDEGFVWSQATFGYPISIAIGGLLFVKRMRKDGYVTMMDPFQETLGNCFGAILSLLPIAGEILWSASTLASLGNASKILTGLDGNLAVAACSFATVVFTALGGIYAVSGTDVILLLWVIFGLWFSLPFVMTNPAVEKLDLGSISWVGRVQTSEIAFYLDSLMLYMLGTVPWQSFHQRILTVRNPERVRLVSYASSVLCYVVVVPAVLMGIIARALDGERRSPAQPSFSDISGSGFASVLNSTTPQSISFIGFCAISSSVMSTASAALLSASSLISRNIYKKLIHKKANVQQLSIIMRITIIIVGMGATSMAILLPNISSLWYISAIIIYVIIVPHLFCIIYLKKYVNACGSLISCIIGLAMVFLSGDAQLGIPTSIFYPMFDLDKNMQLFPFKSVAMLTTLTVLLLVSALFTCMCEKQIFLKCHRAFGINVRKSDQIDSSERHHTVDLDLGLKAEEPNGQKPVETINPALTMNGEMLELQDRKLAKVNLIKSEVFYGNNRGSVDV